MLRTRHNGSLLLDVSKVSRTSGDKWEVMLSAQNEFHTIKWIRQCTSCQLQCVSCNACFHEFVCSCKDNAIRNNMCKHIHLVCRSLNENERPISEETQNEEDVFVVDVLDEEDVVMEEIILPEVIVEEEEDASLNIQKIKLFEEIEETVKNLKKCVQTIEQVDYVRKHVRELVQTLNAMNSAAGRTKGMYN